MKQAFIGILALAVVVGAATGARAQFPTTNLLTNPGAEAGSVSGWTVGGDSNPTVDNGTFNGGINPHSGNFDFIGNNGALGTLTQNVTLLGAQGITATQLDSGTLFATVSFWEQGLNQGDPSDNARIAVTFRNALGGAIGSSVSTAIVDSHNLTWQNLTQSFALPVGTRSLDYQMVFIRNQGADNDSYIDDNSLTITAGRVAATAPEPASLALFTLGTLAAVWGVKRRTRESALSQA